MNIKQKIASAVVLGSMVAAMIAPASFASTTVDISGNGAFSFNKVKVKNTSSNKVKQSSKTIAITSIYAKASTGKNTSSFNTGGSSSIDTGDASNTVGVSVTGGNNTNTSDGCGCVDPNTDVSITDNGALSHNTVNVTNSSSSYVSQSNTTVAETSVSTSASTGGNNSSFNTGGDSSITTGDASNAVGVEVTGGSNSN
jgi:hypothetical protein